MALGSNQPFIPSATVTLAATTTSVAAFLSGAGETLVIYNAGTTLAFVQLGGDTPAAGLTVTATAAAGYPIPPGGTRLIGCGNTVTSIAAIMASGTASIYVTRGSGSTF
jgi:hypothetical protein